MDEADLIVRNAKVTTLHDAGVAKALAVRGEKFVAVGGEAEVLRLAGARTRLVDASGRRVIPGLNDSHLHLIRGGLLSNLGLRCDGVASLRGALEMIREQAGCGGPGGGPGFPVRISNFLFAQQPGSELQFWQKQTAQQQRGRNRAASRLSGYVLQGAGEVLAWSRARLREPHGPASPLASTPTSPSCPRTICPFPTSRSPRLSRC